MHDLITSPAFIVIKAASEFKDKTTAINQLWQTDFTYLKVLGWGWFYLSTILDDYSRYIISWKLCTNMRAEDVTDTLDLALQASGCDQVNGAASDVKSLSFHRMPQFACAIDRLVIVPDPFHLRAQFSITFGAIRRLVWIALDGQPILGAIDLIAADWLSNSP